MNLNTRPIGLAVLSLLLFLGAAVALQGWLLRETRQLQGLAIEEQRAKLDRIIAVSGLPPEKWDARFQDELGAMLGGTVQLYRTNTPPAVSPNPTGSLSFNERIDTVPGWGAQVNFAIPALIRVQVLHQRILATIVLLALLLALVPLLVVVIATRRGGAADTATRTPWVRPLFFHSPGFRSFSRLKATMERATCCGVAQSRWSRFQRRN